MTHPFIKLFDKALKRSTPDDNAVLTVAQGLIEKGYRPAEVLECLTRLEKSLLDPAEVAIVVGARKELEEDEDF
jgi:hypothetical protein